MERKLQERNHFVINAVKGSYLTCGVVVDIKTEIVNGRENSGI